MKNKKILIIGALVIAAIFFLKKKKTTTTNGNPILPADKGNPILPSGDLNLHPIDMLADTISNSYPSGVTEGMRVVADNDATQYIIQNGKKFGLTYDQWAQRGFDAYTVLRSDILDLVPYGGLYNNGI
jgi:hypothetical protein